MTLADLVAAVILIALVIYTLTAGADFGGGVLEATLKGRRAKEQQNIVRHAIAPIWEANHVWLILVIVLLFVCFPTAFAAVSTALHIPLLLMLVGIVLRGSAFTFRAYGIQSAQASRIWGRIFVLSSGFTPFALGLALGGVLSGNVRLDPETQRVSTDFVSEWAAPFPILLGVFVAALCVFLAAVYLCVEATDKYDRDVFRARALVAAAVVGVSALATLLAAEAGAPRLFGGLSASWWSIPLHILTGLAATLAIVALWQRRFRLARILAVVQVSLIVVGFGCSQYPYLIWPDLSIADAAAEPGVLGPVLITLAAGSVVLLPSFWYLYKVFKGRFDDDNGGPNSPQADEASVETTPDPVH